MLAQPLFSIIVPSYNRNEEVEQLLLSLEKQTVKNFEVVIVDDHSKTPLKITHTFSFPVQFIYNEINQGAAGSRNIGAENAKSPWLLFLDDDDRFANNKCEKLAEVINNNSDKNFIYHPAECIMVNEGFHYFTKPYSDINLLTLDNLLLANKLGGMPMIAIKKEFFQQLRGLSSYLRSLEDYDFVLRAVSNPNFNPIYIDEPLTICTFHTKRSSVSTNTQNTEIAIKEIEQKFVKTDLQKQNFSLNALYMLAYPNMMNLSRQAAKYYWKMFKLSHSLKHFMMALVTFISPKLAINLKQFI